MSNKITLEIAQSCDSLNECLVQAHTVKSLKDVKQTQRVSRDAVKFMLEKFGPELDEMVTQEEIAYQENLDINDPAQGRKIPREQLRYVLGLNAAVLNDQYSVLLAALPPTTRIAEVIQFTPAKCWKKSARDKRLWQL